jgi:drug/metabolite transporter (DMT)-like permease
LALTVFSAGAASSAAREIGRRSPLASVVLLVLTAVLVYALISELKAQGKPGQRVGSPWTWRAGAIAVILGAYAVLTSAAAVFGYVPAYERVAGAIVGPLYAALCAYFVVLRHRASPGGRGASNPDADRP